MIMYPYLCFLKGAGRSDIRGLISSCYVLTLPERRIKNHLSRLRRVTRQIAGGSHAIEPTLVRHSLVILEIPHVLVAGRCGCGRCG